MYELKPWKTPECYFGEEWHGWLCFLTRNRDSELLDVSNFEVALKQLEEYADIAIPQDPEVKSIQTVSESHWAVGWVEWIAIHPSNSRAVEIAQEMCDRLNRYPCLDEEDWSMRECEQNIASFKDYWQYLESESRVKLARKYGYSTTAYRLLLGAMRGDSESALQIFSGEAIDKMVDLWETDKDLAAS